MRVDPEVAARVRRLCIEAKQLLDQIEGVVEEYCRQNAMALLMRMDEFEPVWNAEDHGGLLAFPACRLVRPVEFGYVVIQPDGSLRFVEDGNDGNKDEV